MPTVQDYADKKKREIALGQAKKQAVEYLQDSKVNFIEEYEELYKKMAKRFYKWNMELDEELFGGKHDE